MAAKILVTMYEAASESFSVFFYMGLWSKWHIDIGATTKKHSNMVSEILAAHALTGCDTVAYLFGIGKGTVLNVWNL